MSIPLAGVHCIVKTVTGLVLLHHERAMASRRDLLTAIDPSPWPQRSQGVRCRRRTSGTTAGAMAPRWWRLIPLWEASDRLCGKRLQALLPLLVESLKSHDRPFVGFDPQAERRQRLAQPARAYSAVRRRVPVRTFKGWDDHSEPDWLEIDLVAH